MTKNEEGTDLAITEDQQPADLITHTSALTPTERVALNEEMIKAIGPIITRNHVAKVDGKSYVTVAGGTAIANALGFTISTLSPVFVDNEEGKYYEAIAQLLDGGKVIAQAVGVLGMDESRWKNKPIYAKRSMAQTRASARLCRQNFGHFYVAIGASDTPYEEIPHGDDRPKERTWPQLVEVITDAYRNKGDDWKAFIQKGLDQYKVFDIEDLTKKQMLAICEKGKL